MLVPHRNLLFRFFDGLWGNRWQTRLWTYDFVLNHVDNSHKFILLLILRSLNWRLAFIRVALLATVIVTDCERDFIWGVLLFNLFTLTALALDAIVLVDSFQNLIYFLRFVFVAYEKLCWVLVRFNVFIMVNLIRLHIGVIYVLVWDFQVLENIIQFGFHVALAQDRRLRPRLLLRVFYDKLLVLL